MRKRCFCHNTSNDNQPAGIIEGKGENCPMTKASSITECQHRRNSASRRWRREAVPMTSTEQYLSGSRRSYNPYIRHIQHPYYFINPITFKIKFGERWGIAPRDFASPMALTSCCVLSVLSIIRSVALMNYISLLGIVRVISVEVCFAYVAAENIQDELTTTVHPPYIISAFLAVLKLTYMQKE
ncbi:hypothetical protein Trydic_g15831 [Trypoxylus dichotomus]